MSGDYNLVMHSTWDRSSQSAPRPSKSVQTVQSFIDMHKLIDLLCGDLSTSARGSIHITLMYTNFEDSFFLVDPSVITDCEYDPVIIYDHAPGSIKETLPTQRTKLTWQLDTLLLADSDFVKFFTEQIDFFFNR